MTAQRNILVMMSGSIAAYKVCYLISQLKQKGFNLKVVMSESVQNFVGPTTIEGLTGEKPITDMYASGSVMDHIKLARWADLVLLAPATANTLNKMAGGIGDDLISTLFLAYELQKPFLIAPAMNTNMYFHPATQKSIVALKDMGCIILEAASGILACGENGYGKLLEPELILQEVLKELEAIKTAASATKTAAVPNAKQLKILITGGGTSEPIDDVRMITNGSTGKTAARLADFFTDSGYQVTALFAGNAVKPMLKCVLKTFTSFRDLENLLNGELKNHFDYVIHAAAVSDYSVKGTQVGKISSDAETLNLQLVRNKKLINTIKTQSEAKLIGFKLTATTNETEVKTKIEKLFNEALCDFVVQNDWNQIKTGIHTFNLFSKNDVNRNLTIDDLSVQLMTVMETQRNNL